jgi:hypothetical protein
MNSRGAGLGSIVPTENKNSAVIDHAATQAAHRTEKINGTIKTYGVPPIN